MLKRRVRHHFGENNLYSFLIPRPEDYFYSLLYHCLVQKKANREGEGGKRV